jgi:hypothetical protein
MLGALRGKWHRRYIRPAVMLTIKSPNLKAGNEKALPELKNFQM